VTSRAEAFVVCLCVAPPAVGAVLSTSPADRAAAVLHGIDDGALPGLTADACRDAHVGRIPRSGTIAGRHGSGAR